MDQRGPWARAGEGSMQVINASAEGWMREGALGPWSGRRRWRWIGHGEVCGQRPASDFPRHNDLLENGHRKGMFLGYDVVSFMFGTICVNSHSQKFCEHFVSVRCRCSQNAHKVLTKFCEHFVSVTRKSSEAIRQIFTKKSWTFV